MAMYRYRMNLQLFAGEKTERATPKKRNESRKKGQVAKSMELPAALILFFGFLSFYVFGSYMGDKLMAMLKLIFYDYLTWDMTQGNALVLFQELAIDVLLIVAPLFLIAIVVAVVSNYLQFGFLLTADPLKMKLSKLNPIQGFKRLFSMKSLVELLKSILKMSIIGYVVIDTLWSHKESILQLSELPVTNSLDLTASITLLLGVKIGIILIILAIFDFMYQKYSFEKSIRMSKQDIKDEYKKSEGDPLIKSKIRERQRRMALQRMMQEVPHADVVITNPTHFAVAIKYDASQMEAPTVIAKGADYVALKIKEAAKEHNIITMENKPLARALYAQVEIGESIPAELFQAVAEVLAYVYKLKGKAN